MARRVEIAQFLTQSRVRCSSLKLNALLCGVVSSTVTVKYRGHNVTFKMKALVRCRIKFIDNTLPSSTCFSANQQPILSKINTSSCMDICLTSDAFLFVWYARAHFWTSFTVWLVCIPWSPSFHPPALALQTYFAPIQRPSHNFSVSR